MKITKKQFLADVRHEIEALKVNATEVEMSKLNFMTFKPNNIRSCIYGQMTGDCRSTRAIQLLDLCCIRLMQNFDTTATIGKNLYLVNGIKNREINKSNAWEYFSALEGYIASTNSNNKNVLSYLRGETNILVL